MNCVSDPFRYLAQGEKYLTSAYGFAINIWDGTVHWSLYLIMVYGLLSPKAAKSPLFRLIYLYWVGTIMFSLFAFLPGACIGEYSHDIKLGSFLNVPYVLIPLYFLNRVLRSDVEAPSTQKQATPLLNLFFILSFIVSIYISFVRFCAAAGSKWPVAVSWLETYEPILQDNTRFFHMQAYVWFLYIVPYYVVNIYSLLYGTDKNARVISDLSAIIAGGVCQTQFSLLVSVFSPLTPSQYLFPGNSDAQLIYLAISAGLLAGVPLLFAAHCYSNPKLVGLIPDPASSSKKSS